MPAWNPRANEIFLAALDSDDRTAHVAAACAGDADLRRQVEALLQAHAAAGTFLDQPAASPPTGDFAPGAGDAPGMETGTVIAGKYKLLQLIGEGGMGHVWMADQLHPVKRRVAVKLIKAHLDSGHVLARFDAERQALALMDHPNIAKVLDAGTTEAGRPFFVMELVNGMPVTQFCDEARLTVPERLSLFVQICQAVQHAHQKGIIHRDLKPSNVLVERHDDKPVPKVIDFGLAKAMGGQRLTEHSLFTAFGQVAGTPLYMAPEQAAFNALDVDTRADVYSLGVLLYELLTGTTPIEREMLKKAALDELLRVIRESEPPVPSSRLSSSEGRASVAACRRTEPARLSRLVRGDLDWIVMKALEKDRSRRYETANGFARDIERFLNDEPVAAGPPGAAYRLKKLFRRHRKAAVSAALVVAALLFGVVGTTWQAVRADAAWREEARQREFAERRLSQIEKGNEILASVFTDLNPRAADKVGEPLQAILGRRLEHAARQLEGEAVGDPLVVAKLQDALGMSLINLGHSKLAVSVLNKAVAQRTAGLGDLHPDTLASRHKLAWAYHDAADFDAAQPLYERNLRDREATLGADHPDTLDSRNSLGMAYVAAGRPDLAIPILEKTLRTNATPVGKDRGALDTMNNLARAYQDAGRFDDAIRLFQQNLTARESAVGPDHADALEARNNLAAAFHASGRHLDALPHYEKTYRSLVKTLGENHARTLVAAGNLAVVYRDAGRLDEAFPLWERTLKAQETSRGPDHPDVLTNRNNLATAYYAIGQYDKAIPLLEKTLDAMEAKLGPDHPATLTCRVNLGAVVKTAGNRVRGLELLTQAHTGFARALGRDHPSTIQALDKLAEAYLGSRRFADAESAARELLAYREKNDPDGWQTFATRSLLGGSLLGQRKLDEAEPHLLEGYAGAMRRFDTIPVPFRRQSQEVDLDRLVQFYTICNKPADAAKWRAELEALRSDRRETNKP